MMINNFRFKNFDIERRDGCGTSMRSFLFPLFSFFFFLFSFASFAQVTSAVDSASIRIGEELKYTIEVQADTTDLVVFPEGQTFLPLEVIESYKVDTTYEQAKYRLIKKYGLTQFDSGKYTIPAQRVFINEKPFVTDSVQVEVADVVVDTIKQKMFDIKPAIGVKRPPFDFLQLLYWLLPLLIILGALAFIFFRRKKKKALQEKQLPPYEEALVALKKLDDSHLLTENKSKEYYSSLTEIVKRYLDREVDDAALESTTDQLIARLQLHKDAHHFEFDADTIKNLDQILKRADLVKFAKMKEQAGQAEADRRSIEGIINETHEVIPEPTEEELLENEEYLERLRKKKLRKQWMMGISGVFLIALLAGVVYGSVSGLDNLKDAILGNVTRDLTEKNWIKSEYGNPLVIIETPEVLVRTTIDATGAKNMLVQGKDVFSAGDLKSELYVALSTTQFSQPQELELETALDAVLTQLENAGAKNMIVKREEFETDKGINGIKASGTFSIKISDIETLKGISNYELLLFVQQNGLQQILVVYQDDQRFAEGVKDRIINSVELEISQK